MPAWEGRRGAAGPMPLTRLRTADAYHMAIRGPLPPRALRATPGDPPPPPNRTVLGATSGAVLRAPALEGRRRGRGSACERRDNGPTVTHRTHASGPSGARQCRRSYPGLWEGAGGAQRTGEGAGWVGLERWGAMHWKGGRNPPPPASRAPSLCPATVPLTPSAGFNGICNRQ